jgi:hypothetical protein
MTAENFEQVGVFSPIKLETLGSVMPTGTDYVTIDKNPTFGFIQIMPTPPQIDLQADYFDFKPSNEYAADKYFITVTIMHPPTTSTKDKATRIIY